MPALDLSSAGIFMFSGIAHFEKYLIKTMTKFGLSHQKWLVCRGEVIGVKFLAIVVLMLR